MIALILPILVILGAALVIQLRGDPRNQRARIQAYWLPLTLGAALALLTCGVGPTFQTGLSFTLVLVVFILAGVDRAAKLGGELLRYVIPVAAVALLGLLGVNMWSLYAAIVLSLYTLPITLALICYVTDPRIAVALSLASVALTVLGIGIHATEGVAAMHLINTPDDIAYGFSLSAGLVVSLLLVNLGLSGIAYALRKKPIQRNVQSPDREVSGVWVKRRTQFDPIQSQREEKEVTEQSDCQRPEQIKESTERHAASKPDADDAMTIIPSENHIPPVSNGSMSNDVVPSARLKRVGESRADKSPISSQPGPLGRGSFTSSKTSHFKGSQSWPSPPPMPQLRTALSHEFSASPHTVTNAPNQDQTRSQPSRMNEARTPTATMNEAPGQLNPMAQINKAKASPPDRDSGPLELPPLLAKTLRSQQQLSGTDSSTGSSEH